MSPNQRTQKHICKMHIKTISIFSINPNKCNYPFPCLHDFRVLSPIFSYVSSKVVNNTIHHYAAWKRTYKAGILWNGVGHTFRSNYIHHAPHNGILGGGNMFTDAEKIPSGILTS